MKSMWQDDGSGGDDRTMVGAHSSGKRSYGFIGWEGCAGWSMSFSLVAA